MTPARRRAAPSTSVAWGRSSARGRLRWMRTPRSTWVDLLDAEVLGHVDEQRQLHAVVRGQAGLVEHGPGGGGLAGQGLAHAREVGEQEVDHRSGHELGDPPSRSSLPVQRALVEPLHEGDVGLSRRGLEEQGPEEAGHEVGVEVLDIGVEEDEELGIGLLEGHGHGLALARPRRCGPR